jgi:hypothetical protein
MAFTAVCMMFIAMAEFVLYMRSSRKNPQPTVMVAAPAPQPEPAPVPEPVKAEEPEVAVAEEAPTDENSVTFEVAQAQRQTLKEAYDALEKVYKEFYDKILAAANGLEMARIIESTYAVTVMQGRDNVGRLRILRGVVTLDCTVINPDLVKYNKENGKKIKSRPTRFRIESTDELNAAIYTLQVANQTSLENRNVKKKAEKETVNEQ